MAMEAVTIGTCTLYHADCADVLPRLTDISTVFTSPPYNLGGEPWPHLSHWKPGQGSGGHSKWRNGSDASNGVSYGHHDDRMPHAMYVQWQHQILTTCWNTLTEDGAIFYNHKPRVIGCQAWLPLELNPGLPLRQIVTWARSGGLNFNPTAYVPTYEWIMIFAKPLWRLKSKAASGAGDVWYIPQQAYDDHPAPFPIALPMRALDTLSPGIVCDPFMGRGTTGLACLRLGLPFIGIEKDPDYFATAVRNLAEAYKEIDLFARPSATSTAQLRLV